MALGSSALAATGIAAAASQLLKPAASKGAHFTASDHPGAVDRHRHRRAIRPFPGARRAARRPAVRHALPGRKPIAPRPLSQRPLPLPNAQCPTPNAKCPTPNAQRALPIAHCPMPTGRRPLPRGGPARVRQDLLGRQGAVGRVLRHVEALLWALPAAAGQREPRLRRRLGRATRQQAGGRQEPAPLQRRPGAVQPQRLGAALRPLPQWSASSKY